MDDEMLYRWERREAKEESKKRFVSDNRVSVRLIEQFSTDGKPKKLKRTKRPKF